MIGKITSIFIEFTRSEKNSGLVLVFCMLLSLLLANSFFQEEYIHFWHQDLNVSFIDFKMNYSLENWINDGLMTVFFLLVGLEIERELYEGEWHPIKNAVVPFFAALGGMMMPALIYLVFNLHSADTIKGFGIPMATDIAFSLAVLSLVSNRVPSYLKVLLTSLAIIDDIGSILVIALFYGKKIEWVYLLSALGIFGLLLIMNRLKIYRLLPYLILGVIMWYCMMMSGIHATISGVLLAFSLPFNYQGEKNPSIKLQELLHHPVAFIILPVFILANTAIPLQFEYIHHLKNTHSLGIAFGLIIGKPLGIFLSVYFLHKLNIARIPENISWYQILALGVSAGIGFTMSIFITQLALDDEVLMQSAKLTVLLSAFISGVMSYWMFMRTKKIN